MFFAAVVAEHPNERPDVQATYSIDVHCDIRSSPKDLFQIILYSALLADTV